MKVTYDNTKDRISDNGVVCTEWAENAGQFYFKSRLSHFTSHGLTHCMIISMIISRICK